MRKRCEGFLRPVECSEPLVESTCIDSKGKLAVPLINYTGKTIDSLTVRIHGLTNAKRIRSVERGELKGETMLDDKGKPLRVTQRYSKDIGVVLGEIKGNVAEYTLKGDEIYVHRICSRRSPRGSQCGRVGSVSDGGL